MGSSATLGREATRPVMIALIVVIIAFGAAVATIAYLNPPEPAPNPLPLPHTSANRAACATFAEYGPILGAQSLTDQAQGRISRLLWHDLVDVVVGDNQGWGYKYGGRRAMPLPMRAALDTTIGEVRRDCRAVNWHAQ